MEVMDLRPSDHHAVRHMETSSLVSLNSTSSSNGSSIESSRSMNKMGGKGAHPLTELKFSKMPSSLFNVASSGNDDGNGNGSDHLTSGDGLVSGGVEDMPTHWEEADGNDNEDGNNNVNNNNMGLGRRKAAQARTRSSLSLRISNNGKFLLGESEQAYRALMSLMSAKDDNDDDDNAPEGGSVSGGSSHSGSSSSRSGRSAVSGDSHRSGFWSELGDAHMSGSEVSVTSSMSETSPLTRESRRQLARKLYIRRCAKAMVGVLALGVLSMSAIYLISTDREGAVDIGFLKSMLVREKAADDRQVSGSEAEQEGQDRLLKFHRLPGGGSIVEMVEIVKDEKGEDGSRRTLHLHGSHPQEEIIASYQNGVYFDNGPRDLLQEYNEPFTEDGLGFDEAYQDNIAPQGWN